MKILFYNWVQFDDSERRGGGVTVYQNNLIKSLIDRAEVYFLSSGLAYNFRKKVYIRKSQNCYGKKCNSYEIVNSPILSPALYSYGSIKEYLYDESLLDLIIKFCEENGPFDVIHFNNMEGLSINVLKLKTNFPTTKIVFSLHNYYLFCPQVNLWKSESCSCENNHDGADCCFCNLDRPPVRFIRRTYTLAGIMKNVGIKRGSLLWNTCFKTAISLFSMLKSMKTPSTNDIYIELKEDIKGEIIKDFLTKNVDYVNKYVDVILAVSNRVREIAIDKGLIRDKVYVSYIGTTFADHQKRVCAYKPKGNLIKIIYMGYARRDKGFFFLLNALRNLPYDVAQNIDMYFAVSTSDKAIINQIKQLSTRYHSVRFRNGYTHSNIPQILEGINLGIVPVLWEDNMPQIAIELISMGIPILTSSMGGAKELVNNPVFIYKAGDTSDFVSHLSNIVCNKEILDSFYDSSMKLVTMEKHISELMEWYRK